MDTTEMLLFAKYVLKVIHQTIRENVSEPVKKEKYYKMDAVYQSVKI